MLKVLRVGEPQPTIRANCPQRAVKYWKRVIVPQQWFDENKEHFVVLLLNTRYDIQGYSLVSIGSVNETISAPREIFRAAVASGAYAIITVHNHPSGCPDPSSGDRAVFAKINDAGGLLSIKALDHVIVGAKRTYYAFQEEQAAIDETKAKRRRKLRAARRGR